MSRKTSPPAAGQWIDGRRLIARAAELREILPLRHAELRPGRPAEEVCWEGDGETATRHFGVFEEAQCIACASVMLSRWNDESAYRLRGMAVRSDWRNRGVGGLLLRYIEQVARDDLQVPLLWANARTMAIRFYERHGWEVVSDAFDVEHIGPHVRMIRRVDQPKR